MADEKPITTRNLIDSDVGPLRRFTGVLDSMPTEQQTYGEGESKKTSTKVTLNFREIEVLEAIEPYHFPIYSPAFTQSNRRKSRWGVLSDGTPSNKTLGFNNIADQQYSAEQLDPSNPAYVKPGDRMDIGDCLGKRFGLVMTDGEEGRPAAPDLFDGRANDGKGGDVPTPTWTVYSVEGIGVAEGQGSTPQSRAEDLLDGKALADFNSAALADPVIRTDAALLQAISAPVSAPNSFANVLVAAGKFTKDAQEVYHKVGG